MADQHSNPFADHVDRLGSFDAFDLMDAINTSTVLLIVGNDEELLRIPQGLLNRIPYFQSCLRNIDFVETETETFRLCDEDLKTVKQLLTWLIHPIDDPGTIRFGSIALLADKWAHVNLRRSILKAAWAYWRTIVSSSTLALNLRHFYEQAGSHRIRFFALHFLSLRLGQGSEFPLTLMTYATLCNDFAKWRWLQSTDEMIANNDDDRPSRTPDLFRRFMSGYLVVFPSIVTGSEETRQNEWLDTYLDG